MPRLDPTSLQVFIGAIETGTIAAAAEREHIAAAAISKRISELESTLATQLLVRTNKGVEPTAAGLALVHMARRALSELDGVYLQMREYADGMRGLVRVVANISAITQFLPAEIQSFRVKYPEIRLQLEEKISSVITKDVAENAADIGIFAAGAHGHDLEIFDYHRDRLVLIAPPGHALANRAETSLSEALDHDFVGLHPGSAINMLIAREASQMNKVLRMAMQVTSYDALCLMVHSGIGIGVLPKKSAVHYIQTLGLREIAINEAWVDRELKLCVRARAALPPAARLFFEHLRHAPH